MPTRLLLAAIPLAATAALAQDLFRYPAPPVATPASVSDGATNAQLSQWRQLRASDTLPFGSYANFLLANPGWPGETAMRKAAERGLQPGGASPSLIVSFFTRYEPETATGFLRFADALDAQGRVRDASAAARQAWVRGALSAEDEAALLSRYGSGLTQADHDARMDRLLWSRATTAAQRQLPFTSALKQPMFNTRLALITRAADAADKAAFAPAAALNDAGYLLDRASYARATGASGEARRLLAQPRALIAPPLEPARWLDFTLAVAKEAADNGDAQSAFAIARQVGDAYASGTLIRERPLAERDDFTSLAWLGGTLALDRLGRPADAIPLFERYANAARTPSTRSKGLYWAARAAQAAGRPSESQRYFEQAAVFFDQFYGQLAAERLGRPVALPAQRALMVTPQQRAAYQSRSLMRAAAALGQQGEWQNQSLFLRAIAQAADTDLDHALAYDFAARINRPDLAVMVGREAGVNGYHDIVEPGFPTVPLTPDLQRDWLFVHAIARQESQFDRRIVSRAGARGLMQLMPGTARETAGKIGVGYDPSSLDDPLYNSRLGAYYFARLLDRYNGSYPLAVAAYNAGAGNVNKWLAANGDPRTPGADMVRWIERIPFTETRGYVQRVLENAVVYGLLRPEQAHTRSATPLSFYLGKSQPG